MMMMMMMMMTMTMMTIMKKRRMPEIVILKLGLDYMYAQDNFTHLALARPVDLEGHQECSNLLC